MKVMTEGSDQLAAAVCVATMRPSRAYRKVEGNWWSCMLGGMSSSWVV